MLSIFFLISSCSKSGNDPKKSIDPVVDPCRIVTVEVINGTPVTYSYDSQGRVSQTTNLFGFGTGTFTYSTYNVTFKMQRTDQLTTLLPMLKDVSFQTNTILISMTLRVI